MKYIVIIINGYLIVRYGDVVVIMNVVLIVFGRLRKKFVMVMRSVLLINVMFCENRFVIVLVLVEVKKFRDVVVMVLIVV